MTGAGGHRDLASGLLGRVHARRALHAAARRAPAGTARRSCRSSAPGAARPPRSSSRSSFGGCSGALPRRAPSDRRAGSSSAATFTTQRAAGLQHPRHLATSRAAHRGACSAYRTSNDVTRSKVSSGNGMRDDARAGQAGQARRARVTAGRPGSGRCRSRRRAPRACAGCSPVPQPASSTRGVAACRRAPRRSAGARTGAGRGTRSGVLRPGTSRRGVDPPRDSTGSGTGARAHRVEPWFADEPGPFDTPGPNR